MNIFIVPIEPIDKRYTRQWHQNIPKLVTNYAKGEGIKVNVVNIDGTPIYDDISGGAFLDFALTNKWKADQVRKISEFFANGSVKPGDRFLVTDAWNIVITTIRCMSELLDIPVEIHGIWHAGHYDPSDILGYKLSSEWPSHVERSWYHCCDYNYFGTEYHRNMFLKNLDIPEKYHYKAIRSGQPHDYIVPLLEPYDNLAKMDQIIWPHRCNSDKQPEIAESLSIEYHMILTQKQQIEKLSYYNILGVSKILFSCSLHENLGISVMEGVLAGVIPVLPDRCSYTEMYAPEFLYPSEWTSSYDNFIKYRSELIEFINHRMNYPEEYQQALIDQKEKLIDHYLTSGIMLSKLVR